MSFLVLYVGLVYAAGLLAALLANGPAWRRALALMVMGTAFAVPFLVPADYPTLRAFVALGSIWFTARTIELVREPRHLSVAHRAWHTVGLVDTRLTRRMVPAVDRPALTRLLLSTPLSVAGLAGVHLGGQHLSGPLHWAVRWVSGALFLYTAVEIVVAGVILAYRLVGVDPRPLHDDPILSKSIGEFWGRRWNRAVHRFLKLNVFAPVARRGHTELGLALTFGVSALIHFAFLLPALGLGWAAMMGSFFVLQLPLLYLERALGVVRWRAPWARVWTISLLLLFSPLFVEPVLQIVDTWSVAPG